MMENKKQKTDLISTSNTKNDQDESDLEKMSFEQALMELEQIVSDLESGTYTLEETLRYYQRGQKLAQYCEHLLEQADIIIKQISTDSGEESISEQQ